MNSILYKMFFSHNAGRLRMEFEISGVFICAIVKSSMIHPYWGMSINPLFNGDSYYEDVGIPRMGF